MKIKTKNRKNNIKNTTYILVLTTIFILFFTGYSLGKSITQVTIKGNTQIANPIIEVESNPKINITDEQQEGTYNFYVRNYKNTGKITDVKIIYTIKIQDTIEEKLKNTIKYELYKNGNKIELQKNETTNMELTNKEQQEDKYQLKIVYNKNSSNIMQDIMEKIQIQVHSEQANK